jgi:hypothetical protein
MEESKQKLDYVTITMTGVVDSESRGNAELTSKLSHMEIRNFHPYRAKFSLKTWNSQDPQAACVLNKIFSTQEKASKQRSRAGDLRLEALLRQAAGMWCHHDSFCFSRQPSRWLEWKTSSKEMQDWKPQTFSAQANAIPQCRMPCRTGTKPRRPSPSSSPSQTERLQSKRTY